MTLLRVPRPPSGGWSAFLLYTALSILLTWPLVLGIGSDVPGDLGDSLLNMWILAWGAEHVPRLAAGSISWQEFWNANIFHPEPLALALSEHLFGQVLQILPIYWLTGNIILCYNLLFISTFAVSALGAFLLVRDLTGDTRAAFIAGLIYGFLPYRIASVPHLQVMSSQWMPFALWGLNRFVTVSPGSIKWLIVGVAALVMQNWSCGYYLLYFAPFVPLFVVYRMWAPGTRGTLGTVRTWLYLLAAAAGTLALTAPFLFPYQEVQRVFGIERPFGEVVNYSANVWSYITASENVRLWGRTLRFYPHGEGETFLGFTPWLLAAAAVIAVCRERVRTKLDPHPRWRRALTWLLLVAVVTQCIALMSAVIFGGFNVDLLGIRIRATTPQRLFLQFAAALVLLLVVSARARVEAARLVRAPVIFFLAATVLAMWLSLGPVPRAGDSPVSGLGIYGVLYEHVPGFNGVRVPARYAMIAGLFLAVVAGYGARLPAHSTAAVAILAGLIVMESAAIPMEVNRTWNQGEAVPPPRVYPRSSGTAPAVYRRVASLPPGAVITEFPFGDAAWEIRYVFYAALHWKPITNGYSGGFPPRYKERVARLRRVTADPDAAWQAIRDTGTTHVIVHRDAFLKVEDADAVEAWLRTRGAAEVERFPDSILFNLPTAN